MITGFFETVRAFQVRGWAFDSDRPNDHVSVELRKGAETLGGATADQMRADLRDAGIGDGSHGFVINVDVELPLQQPDSLAVVARKTDGVAVPLPLAAGFQVEAVSVATRRAPDNEGSAVGYYTTVAGEVAGWAYDPEAPAVPLKVEIRVGERVVVEVNADQFRPDLLAPCDGHADHGFQIGRVAGLPQAAELIAVFATDTKGRKRALTPVGANVVRAEPAAKSAPALRFPGAAFDADQQPVFVLGAARSGTSAMAQALSAATRYKGAEEGHFFELAMSLVGAVDRHYAARAEEWNDRGSTLISAVPKEYVTEGVKHIFVEFAHEVFPSKMWMDKTPRVEMIAAAPLLKEIWPNARFIFMKRRAIENIASRIRKFPNASFEHHCREWTAAMATWVSVRGHLADSAIEVDQFDLARDPDAAARAVALALRLSEDERQRLAEAFRDDKPERTSAELTKARSLSEMRWTSAQLETFVVVCRTMMGAFNYSLDEEYAENVTGRALCP